MAWMNASSSTCTEHGHPEIRVVYDTGLVSIEDVNALLSRIEGDVAAGARIEHGASYQVGWIKTRASLVEDGLLTLLEPDMIHTPPYWIETINYTLMHQKIHTGVCTSILPESRPEFPSLDDTALICDQVGQTDGLLMRREESGWQLLCESETHDHDPDTGLRPLSLFEAVVDYEPRSLPYIALPVGVTISFSGGSPVVALDGARVKPAAGSALASFLINP